jgi:tRNA threonylcarbamoyladenosine biosynthesis protein TsaB
MLLLALDTSTRQASLALCSEDELLGEYTWHVGNNHSIELLERIQRLFAECSRAMADIDGVAVATGPGSFNGLRVALSTAKALAFALTKPLIGVSTLDVIAAQQRRWSGPICALLEAGRSELYAACYLSEEVSSEQGDVSFSLRRLSDYMLLNPQQLAAYLQEQVSRWVGVPGQRALPPFLLCGEMSAESHEVLYAQLQGQGYFISGLQAARQASALAMLAVQRLHAGQLSDPLLLEPLYVRRPSITTSARKQPLLGGKSNRLPGQRPTGPSETEREEGAIRH